MDGNLTRRGLIRAGGGVAGLALLGQAGCDSDDGQAKPAAVVRKTAPANAMNVVVVVIDSLRTDHIYGRRARTATFDAPRRRRPALHARLPGGDAHDPRAPLDHGGPPGLPVPRLAPVQGPAGPAGLGADRTRAQDLDGVPPGAGLDHRVRDGQPAHRVAGARQVPQAPRPRGAGLRAGAVRAQGHAPGLEGGAQQVPPAVDPRDPRGAADARVPALQPARPRRGGVQRRAGVQAGHRVDRVGPHPSAVRAGGRLLRRPRAVGRAAQPDRPLRHAHHRWSRADPAVPHARRAGRET